MGTFLVPIFFCNFTSQISLFAKLYLYSFLRISKINPENVRGLTQNKLNRETFPAHIYYYICDLSHGGSFSAACR